MDKLQTMLHRDNDLIKLFKCALEQMPRNNYTLILNSMAHPKGAHPGTYNEPSSPRDVAVIIEGGNALNREIALVARHPGVPNNTISIIEDRDLTKRENMDLRLPLQSSAFITINENQTDRSIRYNIPLYFPVEKTHTTQI